MKEFYSKPESEVAEFSTVELLTVSYDEGDGGDPFGDDDDEN